MIHKVLCLTATASVAILLANSSFAQVITVSSSSALQQAMDSVADGGIIELTAGDYPAPSGAFKIFGAKGFTVRAASGATVVLDGAGSTDIVRLANSTVGTGKAVTFDHIVFANGSQSAENAIGGALTLVNTDAIFSSCTFQNNTVNPSTTGGGAQWINGSNVAFNSCVWTGNTSRNYGAGISMLNSQVFITNGQFSNNRINVPNHASNSPGGAIFATMSTLRVANTSFDSNAAGYVGGAIYALGEWHDPITTPTMNVVVTNCLFTNNTAIPDASVPGQAGAPTQGGAIHVEDQTTLTVQNCRFFNNSARQGGAISSYRGLVNVQNCIFRSNVAFGTVAGESIGGAIIVLSADNTDASTGGGRFNRRSAMLTMTDCLVQGDGSTVNARDGGGIWVSGDLNAQFGLNGVQADQSIDNRATAVLTRVAFDRLVTAASAGIPASAGAVGVDFGTLTMDSSMITNCSTSDSGGGISLTRNSVANITNSSIAANRGGNLGGAVVAAGGMLNMSGDNIVDNQLTSGNGTALTTVPIPAAPGYYPQDQPIAGLVQNCVISNNQAGTSIYDGDRTSAPFNQMQYSGNQIFPSDTTAYKDDNVGDLTVAQLNATTVPNSGVNKAPKANTALPAPAVIGQILLLPPLQLSGGAPGESTPVQPFVAYASSGATAMLDGSPQRASAGAVGPTTDTVHTLAVGSQSYSTTSVPAAALNISTRLPVGTGENALIGGFIIGPQGAPSKRVLIRAIGPSLPVAGALQDPSLQIVDSSGATVATNDNWQTTQIGGAISASQAVEIAGTGAPPSSTLESAVIATLDPFPQSYTAIVRGANNGTGNALVEIFDLDAVQNSKLANISTRGFVQTGDNVMIGGFIYAGGGTATNVVVRALGPSLAARGVASTLADPTLDLVDANGAVAATNDDWQSGQNTDALQRANLAPADPKESAIYKTDLVRGAYTAVVRGKSDGTGVALVEVYVF